MAIDVEALPSLTYARAMAVVDAGGTVSRKSMWIMRAAGYAWGCWIDRQRRWTDADGKRDDERNWTPEEDPPPIEASGPYYRSFHTLCESIELGEPHQGELDATDWFDATEAMAEMWQLHRLYMCAGG